MPALKNMPSQPTSAHHLFLVHAPEDAALAQGLERKLNALGVSVYHSPQEALPLGNWLAHGLQHATYALVVVSQHFLQGAWLKSSVERAIMENSEEAKRFLVLEAGLQAGRLQESMPLLMQCPQVDLADPADQAEKGHNALDSQAARIADFALGPLPGLPQAQGAAMLQRAQRGSGKGAWALNLAGGAVLLLILAGLVYFVWYILNTVPPGQ